MLWHFSPAACFCPSILSSFSLPPPSAVFDGSTFSLCLSQSSIWLSTLCLEKPSCMRTHNVHVNIAVWPLPHKQTAAHTENWTYAKHICGTQNLGAHTDFHLHCSVTADFTDSLMCPIITKISTGKLPVRVVDNILHNISQQHTHRRHEIFSMGYSPWLIYVRKASHTHGWARLCQCSIRYLRYDS